MKTYLAESGEIECTNVSMNARLVRPHKPRPHKPKAPKARVTVAKSKLAKLRKKVQKLGGLF